MSAETKRTGLGPDDRGLSSADIFRLAEPVEAPPDPYAPPEPPRSFRDLEPIADVFGAHFRRGDEAELGEMLLKRFLGRYTVSIAGELWQYDPEQRGWWRVPEELAMTWVSRVAGAEVYAGVDAKGRPKMASLKVSASKARGAVRLAASAKHWAEEKGDFWTASEVRGVKRGIAQFQDVAVVITQEGPGKLSVKEMPPEPSLRVRASRVIPCKWEGLPDLDDLPARCPALWRIHREWWGKHGEQEAYARLLAVLEFVGAAVTGYAPTMGRALFLYGLAGTGKSTLIDLVSRWFAPVAVCSVTPQEMGSNRFAPARLDGAVMNVVDDLPRSAIDDAGLWKSSITGGRIDIERKGQDGYGIYPQAGHLYAGNKLPVAVQATGGFWRRWLVVQYDRVFHKTDEDRPILPELLAEVSQIVAFAIAAFVQTGGAGGVGYTEPDCHGVVLREWGYVSDSVVPFAEECMTEAEEGTLRREWPRRSKCYQAYRQWCDEEGRRPVSSHEWTSRITDIGFTVSKVRGIWRVGCQDTFG